MALLQAEPGNLAASSARDRAPFLLAAAVSGLVAARVIWYHTQTNPFLSYSPPHQLNDYGVHLDNADRFDFFTPSGPHFLLPWTTSWVDFVLPGGVDVAMTVVLAIAVGAAGAIIGEIFLRAGVGPAIAAAAVVASAVSLPLGVTWQFDPARWHFGFEQTSVYHNPTYLILKPFALLQLLFLYRLSRPGDEHLPNRFLAASSLVVIVGTLAKPSITLIALPVAGLYCLLHRDLMRQIVLGWIAPAVAVLAWQYWFEFGDPEGNTGGMTLQWLGAMSTRDIPYLGLRLALTYLAVASLLAVPGAWRDPRLRFGALVLAASVATKFLLIETGKRASHGNFGWGAKAATYVMTAIAIYVTVEWLRQRRPRVWIPACLLGVQALVGIYAHVWLLIELDGAQFRPPPL